MLRRPALIATTLAVTLALALPAVATASYGAIAVDPLYPPPAPFGFSFHFATKAGARHKALRECRKHASTGRCRLVAMIHNFCAAVVYSPLFRNGYGPYVAGLGSSKRVAIANARIRMGDPHAKLVVWTCSG